VFVTRYLDIFSIHSLYLFTMKAIYILTSGGLVYVIRKKHPWSTTYESQTMNSDKFPHWKYAVLPCFLLAMVVNEGQLSHDRGTPMYDFGVYLTEVRVCRRVDASLPWFPLACASVVVVVVVAVVFAAAFAAFAVSVVA
jgi:hypothetical protein